MFLLFNIVEACNIENRDLYWSLLLHWTHPKSKVPTLCKWAAPFRLAVFRLERTVLGFILQEVYAAWVVLTNLVSLSCKAFSLAHFAAAMLDIGTLYTCLLWPVVRGCWCGAGGEGYSKNCSLSWKAGPLLWSESKFSRHFINHTP